MPELRSILCSTGSHVAVFHRHQFRHGTGEVKFWGELRAFPAIPDFRSNLLVLRRSDPAGIRIGD